VDGCLSVPPIFLVMRFSSHHDGTHTYLQSLTYIHACIHTYIHTRARARDVMRWQVNWWRQWYPMAFLDDLDPKQPTQVQLLGKMYVIWADHDKTWHAFEDKCPHRLAPLSEGR
jgi:hypothetical protein